MHCFPRNLTPHQPPPLSIQPGRNFLTLTSAPQPPRQILVCCRAGATQGNLAALNVLLDLDAVDQHVRLPPIADEHLLCVCGAPLPSRVPIPRVCSQESTYLTLFACKRFAFQPSGGGK